MLASDRNELRKSVGYAAGTSALLALCLENFAEGQVVNGGITAVAAAVATVIFTKRVWRGVDEYAETYAQHSKLTDHLDMMNEQEKT